MKMLLIKNRDNNTINKLISRLNTFIERISEIENRPIEITQSETNGKKKQASESCGIMSNNLTYIWLEAYKEKR